MTATLANLKQVCECFEFENSSNQEKNWSSWLENFEICTEFEGIVDEKKRRAALLAVAGPKLRELHSTLEEESALNYTTLKKVLSEYFKGKKNLTAERYKFLCMKPESTTETHDAWITRLRKQGEDCNWDKMDLKEAIKLAVTMHTMSRKLQMAIIAQDMDYETMVDKARAIELTTKEVESFKSKEDFKVNYVERGASTRRKEGEKGRRQEWHNNEGTKRCKSCGWTYTERHECKAKYEICISCKEKGHYARMCPKKNQKKVQEIEFDDDDEANLYQFDMDEIDIDQVENHSDVYKEPGKKYPETDINVKINGRRVKMKVDSGAEVTVIGNDLFEQVQACALMKGKKIKLKPTKAKIKPFNSPPITLRGVFEGLIETKKSKVVTKVFVTNNNTAKAILSKYAAFDLGVLKIEIEELVKEKKKVPEVQHLSYQEIKKHLLSEENLIKKYRSLKNKPNSSKQVEEMVEMFNKQFKGIGCHKFRQIKLDVDENVKPRIQAQRRIPFAKREALEEILTELEEEDIIEEVTGPTERISNLVLTPKTDSKMRMNIDMTTANEAIKRTRHVIPTIEELKYKLNGAKLFSKLDMRQGYMQFQLHPDSRNMTVFYTHQGLRRMKRLNFGTNAAAELFQEEVRKSISDISNCYNTYDDIIVFGRDQKEHNEALFRILQRLADLGLTLKREKCEFNLREIKFFGYIFSEQGMRPDPEKVEAVRKAQEPQTVTEMRSFLGMCNFCSHFIPNYSVLTGPLREVTKKGAILEWTKERREAFEKLKAALLTETTLGYFDPNKETRIYVDGSQKDGVGSILAQKDENTGRFRPVRYDSRALTDTETRYSQIEIESLAIYTGIMKCHIYLYGLKDFTVVTDHKPLVTLYNGAKENMPPRVKHHKIMSQGYNFKVIYEKGCDNPGDYLSRHPLRESVGKDEADEQWDLEVDTLISWMVPDAVTRNKIRESTRKCPQMQELMKAIEKGYVDTKDNRLQPFKKMIEELSVENDIILRDERVVIPEELHSDIIQIAHETHLGRSKTIALIKETMWFPAIDRKVTEKLEGCTTCQSVVDTPLKEPLKMTELPAQPWTHLVTDFYGPLPTGEYLLVVQDTYSRFPVVEILRSTMATPVIEALDRVMSLYGIPSELGSDNGPPYQSKTLEDFATYMGYYHNHKIPYAPWANGTAEHFMKNLKKLMQVCAIEKKNWKQQLQRFLRAYRAAPHRTTGFAPATLMFNGRQYRTRLPGGRAREGAFHKEVKQKDAEAKEKMKAKADAKRNVKESTIEVGDNILIKQIQRNKIMSPFDPRPYTVQDRNGSLVVAKRGHKMIKRHVNHCKKLQATLLGANHEMSSDSDTDDEEGPIKKEGRSMEVAPEHVEQIPEEEDEALAHEEEDEVDEDQVGGRVLRPRADLLPPVRYRDT